MFIRCLSKETYDISKRLARKLIWEQSKKIVMVSSTPKPKNERHYQKTNMTTSTNVRQIRLERRSPSYWRVTFDLPPLNIFGPKEIPRLNEIITSLETDEDVKVVVFDSAVEGFFLTHYDFLAKPEHQPNMPPGSTVCNRFPTCWHALAAPQLCPLSRFEGGLQVSGASSRSQATCVSRAGKKPSCRNGRSVLAWFQAAAPWHACRAS